MPPAHGGLGEADMGAKLITKQQWRKLMKNGLDQQAAKIQGKERFDFKPVVKLFTPDAGATWLLTELYPDDPDVAFGLCDLGHGFPELGEVRLSELEITHGRFGFPVERDIWFTADRPLSAYAREAYSAHRIMA